MNKEKKQVATLWILTVLIVILIGVIGILLVKVMELKKEASLSKQAEQLEQTVAQETNKQQSSNVSTEPKNDATATNTTSVSLGRYNVVPDKNLLYDDGMQKTIDDLYVDLKAKNEFTLYDSFGHVIYGTYTIEGSTITLIAKEWLSEDGGQYNYTFPEDENIKIKLTANNGTLEITEAPKSINIGTKNMTLITKVGVKYTMVDSKTDIVGNWRASKALDKDGKEVSLGNVYGSGIALTNWMTFNKDLTYINSIGVTGDGNENGTYIITSADRITLTDMNNTVRLLFIQEDGTLKENNGAYTVIFERKETNATTQDEPNYVEITGKLPGIDHLFVTKAVKNLDNTYTLYGVIYSEYTLTQNELDKIVQEGTMKLSSKTYNVKECNEEGTNKDGITKYGLYSNTDNYAVYLIKQRSNGEYFIECEAQINDVWKLTNSYKKITVDKDTIVEDFYAGEDVTAEKEFSNYEDKNASKDVIYPTGYGIEFDNGKCVKLIRYHGI
ncbi:MAG: hypothetical protein IKP28_06380 [Clostridia bacterium]|nr:hypothetical protein [Clostridia bacterium]